jgi:hypothetical protein
MCLDVLKEVRFMTRTLVRKFHVGHDIMTVGLIELLGYPGSRVARDMGHKEILLKPGNYSHKMNKYLKRSCVQGGI